MKFVLLGIILAMTISNSLQLESYQTKWLSYFYAPKLYGMYLDENRTYQQTQLEGLLETKIYTCIPGNRGPNCIDRIHRGAVPWYKQAEWRYQTSSRGRVTENIVSLANFEMSPEEYLVNPYLQYTTTKWDLYFSYSDIYKCENNFRETLTSIFVSRSKFETVISSYKEKNKCYSGQLNTEEYNNLMSQLTNLYRQLYGNSYSGGGSSSSTNIQSEINTIKSRLAGYKTQVDQYISDIQNKEQALEKKQSELTKTTNNLSQARIDLETIISNIEISIKCAQDATTTYYYLLKCQAIIQKEIDSENSILKIKTDMKSSIEAEIAEINKRIKDKTTELKENQSLAKKALEAMNSCQENSKKYTDQKKTKEEQINGYLSSETTLTIDINLKKQELMGIKTKYQQLLQKVALDNIQLEFLQSKIVPGNSGNWGNSNVQINVNEIRQQIENLLKKLDGLITNVDFTDCPSKTNAFVQAVSNWQLSVTHVIQNFNSFKEKTKLLSVAHLRDQFQNEFSSNDVVPLVNKFGSISIRSFEEKYYNEFVKIWSEFPFDLAAAEKTTRRLLRLIKRR